MSYRGIVTLIFLAFAVLELAMGRLFEAEKTTKKDLVLEITSGLVLPLVVVPGIFTIAPAVAPARADALAHLPWWGCSACS